MPTLERSNPLPLYYQLKEVLKQQIRAGHLAPHTAIPSEPELVSSYHVSRATVRQALTELGTCARRLAVSTTRQRYICV